MEMKYFFRSPTEITLTLKEDKEKYKENHLIILHQYIYSQAGLQEFRLVDINHMMESTIRTPVEVREGRESWRTEAGGRVHRGLLQVAEVRAGGVAQSLVDVVHAAPRPGGQGEGTGVLGAEAGSCSGLLVDRLLAAAHVLLAGALLLLVDAAGDGDIAEAAAQLLVEAVSPASEKDEHQDDHKEAGERKEAAEDRSYEAEAS